MARLMNNDHGQFGRDRIHLIAVRVAQFSKLSVVIAKAQKHAKLFDPFGVVTGPLRQHVLHGCHIVHFTVGGSLYIGRQGLHADHENMPMCVDKPRQHGLAIQVNHFGIFVLVVGHVFR